MQDLTQDLRALARQLLESGTVAVVIGYGQEDNCSRSAVFARTPDSCAKLALDDHCFRNLAVYLTKPEVKALGKCAIVVKGCDLRAMRMLVREHAVDRKAVHLIGMGCDGIGNPRATKCASCQMRNPQGVDSLLGGKVDDAVDESAGLAPRVAEIDGLSDGERRALWQKELSRCIRCYACRQVCPLCYCKRCIVEKNMPQWVETSSHLRGNFSWNTVRAFHLTGRCVGCGECERVCPMGIRLGLLNTKMAEHVRKKYGYDPGMDEAKPPPFTCYDPNEPDEGFM